MARPFTGFIVSLMIIVWCGPAMAQQDDGAAQDFFERGRRMVEERDPEAAGQFGAITGTITDGALNETMVGVAVKVEGTALGAICDLDGAYAVRRVPVGTYAVSAVMIGYARMVHESVVVTADKTVTVDFVLLPEAIQADEVVIRARAVQETEAAVLKVRQEAEAVTDVVSAEAVAKSGGSNVADAMKQVTGTTVVDGKSVVVRGLGDRYMNIQLNGSELPSTSQYNQTVQVDLFPSNLISNIVTQKTFTPDKAGSFTGGSVNIETKSFPDKPSIVVSAATSYNPQANLTGDYLTYDAGSTWQGSASDAITIPPMLADPHVDIPREAAARRDQEKAHQLDAYSNAFNNVMAPSKGYSNLNQSYAVSMGNRFTLLDRPLGVLGSLSYSRTFASYTDGFVGLWKLTDPQATALSEYMKLDDSKSTEDVLWGGLINLSYRLSDNHSIGVNGVLSQNGEKMARTLSGTYRENIPTEKTFVPNVLSYNDRNLKTLQFSGDHRFERLLNTRVKWRHTRSTTTQNEPDLRYFNYTFDTGDSDDPDYNLFNNYFQRPTRSFRELTEKTHDTGVDVTVPFTSWGGRESAVSFGGLVSKKERTFVQRQFEYEKPPDGSGITYDGDDAGFFSGPNLGLIDSTKTQYQFGMTIMELKYPSSMYDGAQDITAGYGMVDLAVTDRLRFTGGMRYETTDMEVSNPTTRGSVNTSDALPAANVVYKVRPDMNVRVAYGRTIARPTIREMAPYATYDFGAGAYVVGNPDLKRTLINNYDIRWEWFPRSGEVLSAGVFYKDFRDPIERVIVDYDGQTTFGNVDRATVMGLEIEARTTLDRFTPVLAAIDAGANCTFVSSEVDIPEKEMVFIRAYDPHAKSTRQFMGQSPYIINLDITWDRPGLGMSSTIFYNIYGRRLSENALGGTPDVYEKPCPTLNYSLTKTLNPHVKLKLNAKNILDSDESKVQKYRGKEFVRSSFSKGRSYTIGFTYSL